MQVRFNVFEKKTVWIWTNSPHPEAQVPTQFFVGAEYHHSTWEFSSLLPLITRGPSYLATWQSCCWATSTLLRLIIPGWLQPPFGRPTTWQLPDSWYLTLNRHWPLPFFILSLLWVLSNVEYFLEISRTLCQMSYSKRATRDAIS